MCINVSILGCFAALQRQNKADLARAAARVEEAEQAAAVTGRQLAGANTDLKVCQGVLFALQTVIDFRLVLH